MTDEEKQGIIDEPLSNGPKMLRRVLGRSADVLFAIALLASGQSSTITGTYAGEFVMLGFLDFHMPRVRGGGGHWWLWAAPVVVGYLRSSPRLLSWDRSRANGGDAHPPRPAPAPVPPPRSTSGRSCAAPRRSCLRWR